MWLPWLWLGLGLAQADDSLAFATWAERLEPPATRHEVSAGYRWTDQMWPEIAEAVARHPGRVEVEQFGTTVLHQPLWAFHIQDPTVPVERRVLVLSGIHALEWIGAEVSMTSLLYLLEHPIPGTEVTVIPLLNPDGRAKVERDLEEGVIRYRRGNQVNVDLNRDFSVHRETLAVWAGIIPGYYGTSDEALSQPESQALDALAAERCYVRAASLHAFGGFLYYPWTGRWQRPPHRDEFTELGAAMEVAQGAKAYKTRQLSHWGFFFRAQGSEIDHLYGRYGTRAFLIELTRSGIEPLRPKTWRNNFRWYNPRDPTPHIERGFRAIRTLARHPRVGVEPEGLGCAPAPPLAPTDLAPAP